MTPESPKAVYEPRIPVLPLRSTSVYPLGVIGVQIGMPTTLAMLEAHPEDGVLVAQVVAPGNPDEPIDARSLEKVGVECRVSDRLNLPGNTVQATLQGLRRVRLHDVQEADGYFTAALEAAEETPADPTVAQELITRIVTALEALVSEVDRVPKEVPRILRMNVADPGRFADLVATLANFSVGRKDDILQILDVEQRLHAVLEQIEQELKRIGALEAESESAPEDAPPTERAAELRHRIKRLQAELGEIDPVEREAVEYLARMEARTLPAPVSTQARTEIERLRSLTATSADASEIRTYLEWLLEMPWNTRSSPPPDQIDLERVQASLDAALIGLDEPKDRLLDYVAVAHLRGDLRGPIPCFVGPPGSGKTTLACALAEGLGRPLAKLEMGGRGEAQLVGARRTRAGAQPGKLISALRDSGVMDPVFLLEEMDEIGLGKVEGDPIEAMEEALQWDDRTAFVDRYLDVPIDLTQSLFVATAQDFFRVPRDLRDLMVEIRLAGYTPEEKVAIARERSIPELIEEHGLRSDDVAFDDETLMYVARGYARDAGMNTLQRALSTLLRTRARAKALGDEGTWTFTPQRIEQILGLPRYVSTVAESAPEIGVVTGLAWTAAGGELMFIEALRMPGSGRLIITGLLGDVMRESVNAAYSYVRSRADDLSIADEAFRDADVHVHFPVGAIPKDGPSAGIAVTLAIASSLSNRAVRHDLAMTGEVTLRGKVLEIGGVKEKVLAAHRAGIRRVILPAGNERDLRDVPDDVRNGMRFHFVERMDEVVQLALLNRPARARKKRREPQAAADTEPRAARG